MADYVRTDNLVIQQGDDRPFTWTLTDGADNPIADFTGYIAKAQVRARESDTTVLHEWSTGNGKASLADSSVSLKVDDSETWEWTHGVYDLLVTPPDGVTEVVARGFVVVVPGVTRG